MKTAVVILNWNGRKLLETFLPSVIQFSKDCADIYVIDNQSTDESIEFIQQNFPEINIVLNKENYGFAKGYNEGLKSVDADIFCLLNSDVEVTKNWIEPIVNLFESDSNIAAIQPKILDYKNKTHFEYAGAAGGFLDNLGYAFCRGRIFWTLEEDSQQYNDVQPIFWASGASMFIRKNDFFSENGFDEDFFAHMEEIDLCWRLKNNNREILYCGASTVYHVGGATLKQNNPQKTYLNFRNSLFMLIKNLPANKLFFILFSRLCLDGISALVFLRYEGFSHLWAVFQSHLSFYRHFTKFYKKRKATKANYFDKSFVTFQYFIKKRLFYKNLQ